MSRRSVLRLAATSLTATAALSARPAFASAPAPARLPALSAAGSPLLAGRLRHPTVLQSFAFDEQHGHVYALQVVAGGVRLPGENADLTHAQRAERGDLCLNRLTLDGSPAGHMYLTGFGHGGSIGVERSAATGGVRLWTEWDANPASGYGRGVCRFAFADGRVLVRDSAALTTYRPLPGSTSNCPALDTQHGQLLLRYKKQGAPRLALYGLDRFRAHSFRRLADIAQPGAELGLPFQGMALYDGYAYQLLGSAYGAKNPEASGGNTLLYRIDMRSGRVVRKQAERTGAALQPREPEGLAVLRTAGAAPRLCLGFTEGPAGGRGFRLYYKALS
ncbi:teichoic acid biosynthesis protein C [Streptomyces sp. SID14478]|uniref:phage baseplate protein n=1 Tax=Streptomyces sp. SID14478 TaxID=2706073 RepID=UPI0013E033F8|nr:teichoic acid biosynthesis protein C [Streptomyces sp. SID14478]NEB80682.1 teichoic acid biosynthesis protein C [Streptomyces sp. SID14478]